MYCLYETGMNNKNGALEDLEIQGRWKCTLSSATGKGERCIISHVGSATPGLLPG